MHKNLPLELLLLAEIYAPNRLSAGALPQIPLGERTSLPRPPSWFRGIGPMGNGKEGWEGTGREREGRASRNAQIQSWQAYLRSREGGLQRGENFWLRLTTASVQCLRLSGRFLSFQAVISPNLFNFFSNPNAAFPMRNLTFFSTAPVVRYVVGK